MNARDLSEPPNGTTSGCPSVAPITITEDFCTRNKGTALETLTSARFWNCVAQITRRRDRAFSVSTLFCIKDFRLGSICRCKSTRAATGTRAFHSHERLDRVESRGGIGVRVHDKSEYLRVIRSRHHGDRMLSGSGSERDTAATSGNAENPCFAGITCIARSLENNVRCAMRLDSGTHARDAFD